MDWEIQIDRKLTEICIHATEKGATLVYNNLHSKNKRKTASIKDDGSIVTESDKEAQKVITEYLKNKTNYPVIGEEGNSSINESKLKENKRYWIVDPIDGTTNYERGHPLYVTTVALAEGDEIIDCCVIAPELDNCYYASKGRGAYNYEKPLSVTNYSHPKSMTALSAGLFRNTADDVLRQITHNTQKLHSGVLETVFVATGNVDCSLVTTSWPWDVAAGFLLVKEAGGKIEHLQTGTDNWSDNMYGASLFWNGNPKIYDKIKASLDKEVCKKLTKDWQVITDGEGEITTRRV